MKKEEERWTRKELKKYLPEFTDLYSNRPISDNAGGMKSHHMFPAWFIVKKLQPKFLIESGVWKGLGTWFFRKASPQTKIISIDPEPSFRVHTDTEVDYKIEDFLDIDWSSIVGEDVLVFFDDHQNCMPRIKRCKELGFNKVIFEDNYPSNQGDCYTPKKILSQNDYIIDNAGNRILKANVPEDYEFFTKSVEVYQEMPPIFKSTHTRWGDVWSGDNYNTPEPLLSKDDILEYKTFHEERKDYTWICYMELKSKDV